MGIKHFAVKASGEKGLASEWNADHTISTDLMARRSTTLIVAAVDSLDQGRADYLCDGIADEIQINAALLAASAKKGTVILLEGTYTLADFIDMKDDTTLEGVGWGSIIKVQMASISYAISPGIRSTLRNLKIENVTIGDWIFRDVAYSRFTWQKIWFSGFGGPWYGGTANTNCWMIDNYISAGVVNSDFWFSYDWTECIVRGNIFDLTSGECFHVDGTFKDSIFTNNIYKGCTTYFDTSTNSITTGNIS